jgi:hypothetical protein
MIEEILQLVVGQGEKDFDFKGLSDVALIVAMVIIYVIGGIIKTVKDKKNKSFNEALENKKQQVVQKDFLGFKKEVPSQPKPQQQPVAGPVQGPRPAQGQRPVQQSVPREVQKPAPRPAITGRQMSVRPAGRKPSLVETIKQRIQEQIQIAEEKLNAANVKAAKQPAQFQLKPVKPQVAKTEPKDFNVVAKDSIMKKKPKERPIMPEPIRTIAYDLFKTKDPDTLAKAILYSEILGKPLALREAVGGKGWE